MGFRTSLKEDTTGYNLKKKKEKPATIKKKKEEKSIALTVLQVFPKMKPNLKVHDVF